MAGGRIDNLIAMIDSLEIDFRDIELDSYSYNDNIKKSIHCSNRKIPSGLIVCDNCEHFIPDSIGDGAGIGKCEHGIEWTQEYNGRVPLFRYVSRHCPKFSKLMA